MTSSSSHDARATGNAELVRRPSGAFRRILVGFDGSVGAKEALRAAASLADGVRGELRVLLVVGLSGRAETPEELASSAAAVLDDLSRELAHCEQEAGSRFDQRVVFSNDPADALAKHAEDHEFDLVVASAPARDPRHPDAGRAMDALVERRPCPVLVV